jgi:hypothetical protein
MKLFYYKSKVKVSAKRYIGCLFLILAMAQTAIAQSFPVSITPVISSPYSPYLSDYTEPGTQKLTVSIVLKDANITEYRCKLRLTIEGAGITIRTSQSFMPQAISITAGINILYGEELAEYFDPANLDFAGISRGDYIKGAKLPDGIYRFSFEVLDYNRGTVVSNKGGAVAWIILNDPPLLNLPRNDTKVRILDPANLAFTWTPRHSGSPNAAFTTEYVFKLVEIWPASRNPYDAVLSQPPVYEVTTSATQIIYGPAEPALIPGRKYAWQVQAKDIEDKDLFKNQGKSEVYTFQFGDPLGIPENLRQDHGISNASVLILRWQPASDGAAPEQYRLRYRKKGTESRGIWYEEVTDQLWVKITSLQPETEYEIQIRAEAKPQYSNYSPPAYFRTEKQGTAKYECGKEDTYKPSGNTNPLMALVAGDTISMRGFTIRVDEVKGGNGNYSGKGWMQVPWFNLAWVHISFSGPVNELHEMYGGSVESIYTPGGKAEQLIEKAHHIGEKPVAQTKPTDSKAIAVAPDYTIPGTVDTVYIEDGKIVVVDTDSNKSTFEQKKDDKTGKVKGTVIADAEGNNYTVGEDGKITKRAGGSTAGASPAVASVSSDEDAFMQEIIQFYLDEITAYLTANPQYDKGPYYSDEVVKVLEDLPTCLQTRADDIAYIKRYLKHLQDDQNDRTYFVNLVRKSVAAFGESLIKIIEARNKPGNSNKKLRDLLPVDDWKLLTNGMCEYLVTPAQEYHITTSVEHTFKTEGDCFTRALKRGMEVKTSFDMAAYAALIETGLCLTEKDNCAGADYWSQFSCGVANGLVQELDVVAMGEGAAILLITQVKNRYNCLVAGDLINVVVQQQTMEQAVHAYSKCVLGFNMTLDEWKKLYSTVAKYAATNWQDPYLHGQATVFVASLVIPVTKLSKVKLLGKLKINPDFANNVDDFAKLSEAAGDSKKLEKLTDELTIVTEAGELLYAKLGVRQTINLTAFTAKSSDDFIDVVVHFSNGKFKAIVEESGSFIEKSIEIEQLAKTLNQLPGNTSIRLLSCNDIATAQKLSKQIPAKTLYASDGWVDLYADGTIQSQSKFQKIVNGKTLLPEVAMDGASSSGNKKIRLGDEPLANSSGVVLGSIAKNGNKIEYTNPAGKLLKWSEQGIKDIDNAISTTKNLDPLESNNIGRIVEGKVGEYVKSKKQLTGFGQKIEPNITDLDISTLDEIIEVKASFSSVKEEQFAKLLDRNLSNFCNPYQKQVILYIDKPLGEATQAQTNMINRIKSQGVTVVYSLDELGGILK